MKGIFHRALTRVRNLFLAISADKSLPARVRYFSLWLGLQFAPMLGAADSTTAQIGAGIVMSFWNTALSPDAYTTLGQIRSIAGVGATKQEIDSTTLDSTAMEYLGSLAAGDTVTIVFTYGAANTHIDRVKGWVDGTTEIDFKLVIPSPALETLYLSITPLHYDLGTMGPTTLGELTFSGRITGGLSATDPHA